jgi:thiol peroxidase
MSDRTVLSGGKPVAVEGPELKPGEKAPDFRLQRSDGGEIRDVTLADFAGKTLLLSVVPSLDTPVCALQTRRFNQEMARLPENVAILTVSTDLPFAQARFCGAEGIDRIKTASDHLDTNFGRAYGVLITEGRMKRCLARAIFIVAPDGALKYVEYVPATGEHPNYDDALRAAVA